MSDKKIPKAGGNGMLPETTGKLTIRYEMSSCLADAGNSLISSLLAAV